MIELMTEEMANKDEEVEKLYLQKEGRAPSTYMVEIGQLKEDNRRLMEMLKNTGEFKEFSGFVDDSGGEVRHLDQPDHMKKASDFPSNFQQTQ